MKQAREGMTAGVKAGDRAPDFTLESQDGKQVSLHDYAGSRNVVVYFYPKDFTRGCAAEARTFSSSYEEIKRLGGEVLGISSDSAESHDRFAEECSVAFPLLSDRGGKVRDMYGLRPTLGILPKRVTFVLDKAGMVVNVFSSQIDPKRHVSNAIEVLSALAR